MTYTCKEVHDKLISLGWGVRLVSPNRPNKSRWYVCKLGEELTDVWRIDANKGALSLMHNNEDGGLSFHLSLSELADKCGIELCDEYDISIDFWRHNFFHKRIDIFTDYDKVVEFNEMCMKKVGEFVKLINEKIKKIKGFSKK